MILVAGLQLAVSPTFAQTGPIRTASAGQNYVNQAAPFLDFFAIVFGSRSVQGLLRDVRALDETERPPDGNVWFWTDDNATSFPEAHVPNGESSRNSLLEIHFLQDGPFLERRKLHPQIENACVISARQNKFILCYFLELRNKVFFINRYPVPSYIAE